MDDNSDDKDSGNGKISKATSKYLRGSSVLFGGRIISVFLKFLIQILIVRYLTKEDFGAFSYALTWIETIVILSLLSLDKATSRFVPLYDEEGDNPSILGIIALTIGTVLGVAGSIIILFLAFRGLLVGTLISDPLSLSLLTILIFLAPLRAIDNWIQNMFAAFSEVRAIFFRRYVLWPGFQFAIIVFVIATNSSVQWLAIGYLVGGLVTTVMYVAMLYYLLKDKGVLNDFSWSKVAIKPVEVYSFSLPMFFTGIVLILRSQLAVILLEYFGGTVDVAEYRAVQPAIKLNTLIYDSFVFLYLPMASRLFAQNDTDGMNDLFWRTSAWIAIATTPIFFVTFALSDSFVTILLGQKYADAALIMAIMALGSYFNAVMGFNKDTLRAYNKVKYLFFVDVSVMVTALVSFFLLIPQYGALGGAIAYTFAIIVNNVLYHIGLVRYTGIKLFDLDYAQIYIMILAGTVALIAINQTLQLHFFIELFIAAIFSLFILRLNVKKLQIKETFPEILKIPYARFFLE